MRWGYLVPSLVKEKLNDTILSFSDSVSNVDGSVLPSSLKYLFTKYCCLSRHGRQEMNKFKYFNFRSYTVDAHQDETAINHWAGKQYLSDLKGATQYKARVSAENDEGWSKPGEEWNFATLGAVPSPASVRGSAASISSTAMILISCLVLSWRM